LNVLPQANRDSVADYEFGPNEWPRWHDKWEQSSRTASQLLGQGLMLQVAP